jgi:hypothetical protein
MEDRIPWVHEEVDLRGDVSGDAGDRGALRMGVIVRGRGIAGGGLYIGVTLLLDTLLLSR